MTERWRSIPGWPYSVSDKGRVRNDRTDYVLSPSDNGSGYRRVTLSEGGNHVTRFVHRLVLEAFVGPCPEDHVTNHKNGMKDDNRSENLEWVTPSENVRHAVDSGLTNEVKGEDHAISRLTAEDVLVIRKQLAKGEATQEELADFYDVDQRTISLAARGETWTHVGGPITRRPSNSDRSVEPEQVIEMRRLYESDDNDLSYNDIAEMYGMTQQGVGKIIRRDRWADLEPEDIADAGG